MINKLVNLFTMLSFMFSTNLNRSITCTYHLIHFDINFRESFRNCLF